MKERENFKYSEMRNKPALTLILLLMFMVPAVTSAQGKIPPFRMIQADNTLYRAEDLPFGMPVILVYFSPDCEDCQKFTKDLVSRINDFKGVSFAFITYQQVKNVADFAAKFSLLQYKNIHIGTEGSLLFVRNYYRIVHFPFIALYSKMGDLKAVYNTKEVDLDDLLWKVKLLQQNKEIKAQ